ncbi:glutathione ABC transporter ATP-binding protein GsiA, partial [Paraburkholderia sp. A1RI_3L]
QIFDTPSHVYTRALLAAVPRLGSMRGTDLPARFPLLAGTDVAPIQAVSPSARSAPDTAAQEREPILSVRELT